MNQTFILVEEPCSASPWPNFKKPDFQGEPHMSSQNSGRIHRASTKLQTDLRLVTMATHAVSLTCSRPGTQQVCSEITPPTASWGFLSVASLGRIIPRATLQGYQKRNSSLFPPYQHLTLAIILTRSTKRQFPCRHLIKVFKPKPTVGYLRVIHVY